MNILDPSAGRQVQACIIGAGPSGLAAAIELGLRGVKCLVVERNDRVGYAPRAKTTNVRTRTHFRRWGIAGNLAAAAPFGVDYPSDVRFVTRLSGSCLAVIRNASNCAPTRNDDYPEHGQWIPQYKLEQVMRQRAAEFESVSFRFSTEFVTATQDGAGVSVTLRDALTREEDKVQARFLIGADGARSAVRELIGANMKGEYGLSRNFNIVFRAPGLAEAHPHGPGTMYWQVHPDLPSLIGPMDVDDVWFLMPTRLPEDFEITSETAASLIRQSTGIDLPYEILRSDEWVASSLIADRYRDDRIFLIGDACHLHPPFGGYGMNMGVADGVDLGWKLAAVSAGWGGPALLDSFEIERRQIHEAVIAEAAANHAVLSNDLWRDDLEHPGPSGDAARERLGSVIVALKAREFHTLGTVLGGHYGHSPIIVGDGTDLDPPDSQTYVPSSRPGCLAPHVWRADERSIYDAFGWGLTLICLEGAEPEDIDQAAAEARRMGVPFTTLPITDREAAGRYTAMLTLVRPDQYVAWRGERWQPGTLSRAVGWNGAVAVAAHDALPVAYQAG